MFTKSLIVVVALTMRSGTVGVVPLPVLPAQSRPITAQRIDVRELLLSARGVAPALCALAADGASGWGGGWDAPDLAIRGGVRELVASIRGSTLGPDEGRALLDALGSDDACVRHL